ncbi:hypothetical protein HOP50_13g68720 [Chloropicon primus]|nr:hypothetical protein HOP50_13g68720 [Chloropicon primus]
MTMTMTMTTMRRQSCGVASTSSPSTRRQPLGVRSFRSRRLRHERLPFAPGNGWRVVVRSGIDNDDLPDEGNLDEVSMESLFASELKRREIAPGEDEVGSGGQLEKSRALQAEGLEGLPARAKELLTLGATSTLAFAPLGAVVAVAFATLAFGLGDSFVHTGGAGPPPYVDPNELLDPANAPGVPYVRFNRNYTDYYADGYPNPYEQRQAEESSVSSTTEEPVSALSEEPATVIPAE